jgi:FKBP-type peptidyl-prolyl cis-trans isomerase FkpA
MKKFVLFSSMLGLLSLTSCLKNQDNKCNYNDISIVAPQAEQDALLDSLTNHGIQAQLDPSGFYYTITNPGSGDIVANLCTVVATYYKGGFFNGESFDSSLNQTAVFQLGGVIAGWQKGIPLIKKGGEITLYIPPSLGYGSVDKIDQDGNIIIPANSYLVFNVTLADLQNQ